MKYNKATIGTLALTLGACMAAFFAPVHSANAEAFTAEQTQELEALFKKYIEENPRLILDSVDAYQIEQENKRQQAGQENLKDYKEYFASETVNVVGNPKGEVTLVEFFDYNCGYCRSAFLDIQSILQNDKNLRVVFEEMPLLSPSSQIMAGLALAAGKQGKYFEMHQAFMNYKGPQSDEAFEKLAEGVGLDVAKLKEDAQSEDIQKTIAHSLEMAANLGIRGTPGFVIADQIYPGYIGREGLEKAVKEAHDALKTGK